MYLTLRDRPGRQQAKAGTQRRQRVATTVVLLGVVSMFTDISTESVNAILPKYLIAVIGLSPQAFGLVNGLYTGISAFVRIFGGWIADRTDHPKWVAFVGYGVSAASRIGLLYTGGLGWISSIITIDRLGKGLRTAPRDSLIAASSRPEALGRAYGVHRSLDSLGSAIGPLIAFWVLSVVVNGYHTVFVVSLAFAVVGVALLVLIIPDRRPRRERDGAPSGSEPTATAAEPAAVAPVAVEAPKAAPAPSPMTDVAPAPRFSTRLSVKYLANPYLLRLVVAASLLGVLTIGDAYLYLQLSDRDNLASNYFALLMVGMNAAYLILAIPLGRLADRIGRAKVFIGGHIALALCYICAAGPFAGAALTVGTLALLGTYYAATDGTLAAMAGRIVDPAVRTSSIATAQTFQAVAGFASSLIIGLLWAELHSLKQAILWYLPFLILAIPVGAFALRGIDRHVNSRTAVA